METSSLAFSPIVVSPVSLRYELLLTATTAVSHHDPAVQDESNRTMFNRQKQLLAGGVDSSSIDQMTADAIADAHPVPTNIVDIFQGVSFIEFVAVALSRIFVDFYNSSDGEGLFSGIERYSRLEARIKMAAIGGFTLRSWWNRLCNAMQVSIHGGDDDDKLFRLLALPAGLQQLVLRCLTTEYRSVVALARLWHTTSKLSSESYANAIGKDQVTEIVTLRWIAEGIGAASSGASVVEVPAVSGNSLRHQVVREPSWLHLCQQLGLEPAMPGKGPVPPGVEAIFYNGGNIAAGAKQPSNVHGLAMRAREVYPSLDLLAGVTDSFDLGESRLKIAGWLVCAENRVALSGSPAYDLPAAAVSVFEMIDDVTLTRQAGLLGVGQMIYSFETLCPGAQVLCRMCLAPYTPALTRGALLAAILTFLADSATIGGQAARGFGHCIGEWLGRPEGEDDLPEQYEFYLRDNREALVAGLTDGTLGTGSRILT